MKQLNEKHDPDHKHHLLRMVESFNCHGHLCLVFELVSSVVHLARDTQTARARFKGANRFVCSTLHLTNLFSPLSMFLCVLYFSSLSLSFLLVECDSV